MIHVHQWATTALQLLDGRVAAPCADGTCDAAMVFVVQPGAFPLAVCDVPLDLIDLPGAGAVVKVACHEATHDYQLDTIPVPHGGTVLDIGAHVGTVSCYYTKARPDVRVCAIEPVRRLFDLLVRNLAMNGGTKARVLHVAVGAADVAVLRGDMGRNTGGATAYGGSGAVIESVPCVSLERLLDDNHIDHVDLLKIDCEGAEHDVLTDAVLGRVGFLIGEFHHAPSRGHDAHALLARAQARIGEDRVRVTVVNV